MLSESSLEYEACRVMSQMLSGNICDIATVILLADQKSCSGFTQEFHVPHTGEFDRKFWSKSPRNLFQERKGKERLMRTNPYKMENSFILAQNRIAWAVVAAPSSVSCLGCCCLFLCCLGCCYCLFLFCLGCCCFVFFCCLSCCCCLLLCCLGYCCCLFLCNLPKLMLLPLPLLPWLLLLLSLPMLPWLLLLLRLPLLPRLLLLPLPLLQTWAIAAASSPVALSVREHCQELEVMADSLAVRCFE